MTITIDWASKIINVPKSYTSLIQSSPLEIRQLDINTFRLDLKDLETSEEGMPFPSTHTHNTEVILSGVTYARIVEIINDYTITFEDGQYALNLVNANSNIADRVNVNQVSIRTSNSAGLISVGLTQPEIRTAVWDASSGDYTTSGSMGAKLNAAASGDVDLQALADAVWDSVINNYNGTGSVGLLIQELQSKLDEVHLVHGLNPTSSLYVSGTERNVGNISQSIDHDSNQNTTTVTRI